MEVTFQQLKTDYENAKILDFRDPTNPNNKIALICEHASNNLPEGYTWSDNDRTHFANENWAWDQNALENAVYLASELKCVLVHSLYSRLLIDVDRDIPSEDLFLKHADGAVIELNAGMSQEEELNRITKYHVTFYHALREVSEKVDPKYVIGVGSFSPSLEGEARMYEIGLEYVDSEDFANKIFEFAKKKGYNVEKNQPYPGIFRNVINTVLRANYPLKREGVELELRTDVLQDDLKALQLRIDLLEMLKTLCYV